MIISPLGFSQFFKPFQKQNKSFVFEIVEQARRPDHVKRFFGVKAENIFADKSNVVQEIVVQFFCIGNGIFIHLDAGRN